MSKTIGWVYLDDNSNLDFMFALLKEICLTEGMPLKNTWLKKRKIKRI